jgi:hypothetical protein
MQHIKTFLFGIKTKGEPITEPNFKTTEPTNRPTQDEWVKQVKFGSRYGHRGSFYQNR